MEWKFIKYVNEKNLLTFIQKIQISLLIVNRNDIIS